MIELTYFSDELDTWNSLEQVQLGVEAGATAIEARSKLMGHDINDLTDAAAKVLKGYLADSNARVGIVGSGVGKCDLYDPDDVALNHRRFRRMCELAHIFDTKVIRVFGFWNPGYRAEHKLGWDKEKVLPRLVDAFGPIVEHAKKEGVVLAMEPEADTFAATCVDLRTIMDAVDSDAMNVAWDVINTTGGAKEHPLPGGYGNIRGKVVHVHVKPDSNGTIDTVADTDVTWRQIFAQLDADGFKGCASIEHWGSAEAMLSGIRQTRALLDDMGLLKK
jgi:sugar phosphate isomerase/epimerase